MTTHVEIPARLAYFHAADWGHVHGRDSHPLGKQYADHAAREQAWRNARQQWARDNGVTLTALREATGR